MTKIKRLKEKSFITSKRESSQAIQEDKTKTYYNQEPQINKEQVCLKEYEQVTSELSVSEKLNLIIASIGLSSSSFTFFEKIMISMRLIPFCEKSYHSIELGGPGTGKSATYQKISPHSHLFSGEPTEASIFGDKRKKEDRGLIGINNVFAMDEIAEINSVSRELATKFRTFLTDGETSRDKENSFISDASVVLLGNLKGDQEKLLDKGDKLEGIDLFEYFPEELKGNPMKDRFAYLIPGWHIKIGQSNYAKDKDFGMNSNYFSEILYQLRQKNLKVNFGSLKNRANRELQNIKSSVRGLIKLIFPNEDYTDTDLEAMVTLAEFGRKLIFGEYINIFAKKSMKIFVLKVIEEDLKIISNRDLMEIEEVYFYPNRVLIKYIDDKNFYKVALNREGKKENEKEYRAWSGNPNLREVVASINDKGDSYLYITQEYRKPNSKSKMLTNWKEELKKKPSVYLGIEDPKLKEALSEIVNYHESALLSEKNKVKMLEKEIEKMTERFNQSEEEIDEQFRKLKLEIIELTLKLEELENNRNFYGIEIPQHAGFEFRKIPKKLNTQMAFERINKLLSGDFQSENYSVDSEGNIQLINFTDNI
ncbi:MAG: BREX system Lon protease-like protein BrxL [Fusobacteriaceae bacterium]